jgi:peptidoglycan hydrolase-like protein with peptidoglycan-binding domain
MVWTPPGFTLRPVCNRYNADGVARHFGGDVPDTLGLVLHVQDGNGSLFGWFNNPRSQASSAWWAGKKGEREQYGDPDLERFWTQVAGNWTWHAIECEGTPDEPMTPQQIETVAQVLAAGHERYGWPLVVSNDPTLGGLGWHGMGALCGVNWGHPYCPGDIRRAQMPAIVARAKQIAGEEVGPVAVTDNGWPVLTQFTGIQFVAAGEEGAHDVVSLDLAVLAAWQVYRHHTEIEPVTAVFGGRTIAQQAITNAVAASSNHLSSTAWDVNGGLHPYEWAEQQAGRRWRSGFNGRQLRVLRDICDECEVLQNGIDFNSPWRDPMHWQIRQANPGGRGPRVVSAADVARAARKIRAKVERIQRAVGATVDGYAGPGMLAAVEKFQKEHGLVVDGIVGPATEAAFGGKHVEPDRADRSKDRKPVKRKPKHDRLKVDGVAGRSTIKELQRQLGTKADGTISSQPRAYRAELHAWTTVKFAHGKAAGSSVVRALQKKVGAHQDGLFGDGTAKHLQEWLRKNGGAGLEVDGIPGERTVKALQRALNRQDFK